MNYSQNNKKKKGVGKNRKNTQWHKKIMARHENNGGVTRENIAHKYKVLGPPHFFVNRSFLWSYPICKLK
jgi:hypothetical protein